MILEGPKYSVSRDFLSNGENYESIKLDESTEAETLGNCKWHDMLPDKLTLGDEETQSVAEMTLATFSWLWPSAPKHTMQGGRLAEFWLMVSEDSHSCFFPWTSWEYHIDKIKLEAGPYFLVDKKQKKKYRKVQHKTRSQWDTPQGLLLTRPTP